MRRGGNKDESRKNIVLSRVPIREKKSSDFSKPMVILKGKR
jgi:hypothetical protein